MTKYHLTGNEVKKIESYSKYRDNYFNIKKFNNEKYKLTYHKLPVRRPGFECEEVKTVRRDVNEDKLSNHLIRAKSKVFEYSMCNNFDYFVTLTLSKDKYDRHDLSKYIKDLGQFIRDYRKRYDTNIQYLLIPEQHKDGAWHMHGLIKGIPEEHLSVNSNGYKDWQAYSVKFGYMSIDEIRCQEAVSKYITKYISKTLEVGAGVTEKNKKLYYASRGLNVAEKVKEGTLTSWQLEKVTFDYENDYVKSKMLDSLEYLRLNNQISD